MIMEAEEAEASGTAVPCSVDQASDGTSVMPTDWFDC